MVKIIIAGSRDFNDFDLLNKKVLEILKSKYEKLKKSEIEIISGMANGADKLGFKFAVKHNLKIKKMYANWNLHGKSAGYIRNKEMAEYVDREGILILFWDGISRGSKHMKDIAEVMGIDSYIIKYKEEE